MSRKTKKRGGMFRRALGPIAKATSTVGEAIGKDYLQKKSFNVSKGLYEEPSLIDRADFLLTGNKPIPKQKINLDTSFYKINDENQNPNVATNINLGGKTKKRKQNKNKKTKRNKNRK